MREKNLKGNNGTKEIERLSRHEFNKCSVTWFIDTNCLQSTFSELNYILCEGAKSPTLTCSATQIIIIEDAIYGRTDSSVCPHPSVKSSVSYSCKRTDTSRVASNCDYNQECLPDSSNIGGDPCPGTYKYLNVTYRCVEGKRMVGNIINIFTVFMFNLMYNDTWWNILKQ